MTPMKRAEPVNPETCPDDVPLPYYAHRDADRDANEDFADAVLFALGVLIAGLAALVLWAFVSFASLHAAHADILRVRDNGRYADSPLKSWFDSLTSGKGPCCSFADGFSISDVDYDTRGPNNTFRVRLCKGPWPQTDPSCQSEWVDVPPEAVVQTPNRYGPAVVWPYLGSGGETLIRCFLPGAGA